MLSLDGMIFAYHYPTQLAFITTFDHPHAHNFHLLSTRVIRMSWV